MNNLTRYTIVLYRPKAKDLNLNKMCETVQWFEDSLDADSIIQRRISLNLGRDITKFGGKYYYTEDRLLWELCKMNNMAETERDKILKNVVFDVKIVKILI